MIVLEPQEVEAFAREVWEAAHGEFAMCDCDTIAAHVTAGDVHSPRYAPIIEKAAEAAAKRAIEQCADIADQHNSVEGIAQRIAAAIRGLLTGEVGEPRKGKR